MSVSSIAHSIAAIWNGSALQTECFYVGIRADIAHSLRMAPNRADFNAAFELLSWYQSGDGLLYCALN